MPTRKSTPSAAPLVLVADDDEMMRSLITAALREHGFETVEVGNGRDAVTLLGRLKPDMIILDVQMPVMDGFAACAEIRNTETGDDIPIVIVTGTDDTTSIEHAFDVGATDFISKPVNWSLLGFRMRYVLRGAETRRALAEREAENSALLEALPDRIILVEQNGAIIKLLENEHYGRGANDITGEHIDVMLPPDVRGQAKEILHAVLQSGDDGLFEFQNQAPEPQYFEARVVSQSQNTALFVIRDVTDKKLAEARIHQLAYYDSVTKLPNRHYFQQVIAEVLKSSPNDEFALYSIDLDQFKRINDNLGHETGDDVLIEVGRRLAEVINDLKRSGCYADLARLSGDEFVILTALKSEDHLREITQMIDKALKAPVASQRQELLITPSVGIATYPEDGETVAALLKRAAQALTAAKQGGGNNFVMYRHLKHTSAADTLRLEFELKNALDNDGLMLHFQPKYRLADGALCGAEALLRWHNPERGPVSPAEFIPLAERSGLIVDIDRWVTERVCRQLREWDVSGYNLVPISINLSGRSFAFDRPALVIASAMAAEQIAPHLLEVEITETVLMADAEQAVKTLNLFKNMGIRLAIDDFGTGYSSLSYLKRFPLDVLKIDRAFIEDLESDSSDQALCLAMISMAHSLGLEVVAEGIETEFQQQFLHQAGCETAQGFLLDKPMPADEFAARLKPATPAYAFHPKPPSSAPRTP